MPGGLWERVWQSIGKMPLIASMIDGALDDTRDHIETLTKARTRPHVLDDATIDRVERVHNEQLEFVDIYAQQIRRWRTESPTTEPRRVSRRLQTLRGWSHGNEEDLSEILT